MRKETIEYFCDNKGCKTKMELKNSIAVEVTYNFGKSYVWSPSDKIYKHLCPSCAEKLGIVRKVVKEDIVVSEVKTSAEELYNIIAQIAWENTQR
jgi:hypothetical protein